MTARPLALLLALALALPAGAFAQDRPDEDAMFGAEPAAAAPTPASAPQTESLPKPESVGEQKGPTAPPDRDAEILGGGPTLLSDAVAPEDPLRLGGQFYMRATTSGTEQAAPSQWAVSAPTLVDAFFDARPNERVRAFVLGRLSFDPTIPEADATAASADPLAQFGVPPGQQLGMALDQLWLNFDIEHTVFVTAGKQHVKWGPARFWNPTDFLHQVNRNPLAVFDARTGTTMLKLHAPWEKRGWNFYAVGIFEDAEPTNQLGGLGGAARAEIVLGQAEFGASAIVRKGRDPKLGLDLSAGVGPIDVYAEASLRRGSDATLYRLAPSAQFAGLAPSAVYEMLGDDPSVVLEAYHPSGLATGATVGASWDVRYGDEDVFTLGAEYFYNSVGYQDSELYPLLMMKPGAFNPFYVGQHYAGLYGLLMAPGRWNNTVFTLSSLANLSDRTFITRLDYSVVVLTHLRIEAFGAAFLGREYGEFHPGFDGEQAVDLIERATGLPIPVSAPSSPAQRFQAGVGLRVNI